MRSTHSLHEPLIFYPQNRTIVVALGLVMTFLSLLNVVIATSSRSLWVFQLLGWPAITFIKLRTRLILSDDGLEYRTAFGTIHASWSEVNSLVAKRAIGPLSIKVELLSVTRSRSGRDKHYFIPLAQFGNSWKQGELREALQQRVPHIFP